jgi:dTDP-4-dehydrorhamnose reductase
MAILLFGATGMLGQAIGAEARRRGSRVIGASRHGPDIAVDLTKAASVRRALDDACADLVINAAAMTAIDECEADPGVAYAVNARAVAVMSAHCRSSGAAFVHVSTDHFFSGDRDRRHDEHAPVRLVNEYARTKFAGESFARTNPDSLVLRTNVTGLRDWMGRPTFVEWVFDALRRRASLVLFDDFYTSTIDARSFARALFDLAGAGHRGLVNVASRTVASKRRFVHALASARGISLDWDASASVKGLDTPRAESLGLDVSRAEALLGYAMPDLDRVARTLAAEWKDQPCAMPLAS